MWWLGVTVALVPLSATVTVNTSTDNVLDRSDPAWDFYRSSVETFGVDEIVVVALESPVPLDQGLIRSVRELSSDLAGISGVARVDSLSTVPLVRFSNGVLHLVPALGGSVDVADSRELREDLAADLIARDSLISKDMTTAAVNVQLEDELGAGVEAVVRDIREVAARYGAWVSGVPIFRTEINTTAGAEIITFVVATVALVAILLFLVFRSFVAVAAPLGVGGSGTLATLAAMSASGTPITLSTVILPSIMLALGCAYSMHFLAAAVREDAGADLAERLTPVIRPTALSGLTTTIGFLAIAQVRIDAIREVGAFGALGLLWVVAMALTAIPAALTVWPPAISQPWGARKIVRAVPALRRWWTTRGEVVLLASGLLVGALGVGLYSANVETDVTRWFPRGHHVRDSYEQIREKLSGISSMNVVLRSEDGQPLTTGERMAAIDQLSRHLGSRAEIGKALAITDPLRQMHGGFRGQDSLPLPTERAEIEQYLLVLDSVDRTRDLISFDRTTANIRLRVDNNGSRDLLDIAGVVDAWWAARGVPGVSARATGIMYEFARAQDEISFGQARGLGFALLCIAAILVAIYRSISLAAVGLIPNVVPLVAVFGFLGAIGAPLDAGLIISACLILGIAVDNTLHVVSGFVAEQGRPAPEALQFTFVRVLTPLVVSTLVIGVGFSVLIASSFVFVRNLGLLVVSVMFVCLVADAVLLPAILVRTHSRRQR